MNMIQRVALGWAILAVLSVAVGAQTLIVQIDLVEDFLERDDTAEGDDGQDDDRGEIGGPEVACSIMQVDASGSLTELVSNAAILSLTGETSAECNDTGLAIAPDGTIYFSEDISHHIFRRTPDGTLSIFVDAADIDVAVGTTSDNDNGMDVGPDGTLFVADEDCDCIYTVSPDGGTLEIIVTEADIGAATGNIESDDRGPLSLCDSGAPVADLDGGLVVAPNGVIYFADDGAGCNPNRPSPSRGGFGFFDSLDSILSATPDGLGGYDVAVVADEDDIFAALPSEFPMGFDACANNFVDLDLDIELGLDGFLYVLEDGTSAPPPQECQRGFLGGLASDDKVLRIDPDSGAVSLVAGASTFGALSGAQGEDQADLEGGIGISGGTLFVGDRVVDQPFNRGLGSNAISTIFEVSTGGAVSVLVSDDDLQSFYGPLYPGRVARLSGGLDTAIMPTALEVPVLDRAGIAAFVALLSLLAFWTTRRRL